MRPLAHGYKRGAQYPCLLLKTGQTTQYNSELDDGYYETGVAKEYTVLTAGQYSGTTNIDLAHLIDTGISFDAASKEIRCTGKCGVFKAAGGETIVVSGAAQAGNNGVFTTVSATADKVVVVQAVTDESAGASITIAKREAMSNNCSLDNKTGRMWTRYCPIVLGVAGNGLLYYTGFIHDAFEYCALCNTNSLGGHNDWRIPNLYELLSIMDYQPTTAYPDSTAFPYTGNTYILCSTIEVSVGTAGLRIYTVSGIPASFNKATTTSAVMLVRGGL